MFMYISFLLFSVPYRKKLYYLLSKYWLNSVFKILPVVSVGDALPCLIVRTEQNNKTTAVWSRAFSTLFRCSQPRPCLPLPRGNHHSNIAPHLTLAIMSSQNGYCLPCVLISSTAGVAPTARMGNRTPSNGAIFRLVKAESDNIKSP